MTAAELREAVALAILNADIVRFDLPPIAALSDVRYEPEREEALREATAAIAVVLDAAAGVARDCAIYDGNDQLLNSDVRATCAAAIRALKGTDNA